MQKKESAQPHKNAELSAGSKRILTYPSQKSSACAEVLAHLLAGEVLTAADTLDDASTMRAAAHVHYLSNRYGWPIAAETRATGCADGRMALVAAYRLPADCIHEARAAGAGEWCAEVHKARKALRAKAQEVYRLAAAINGARGYPEHCVGNEKGGA